MSNPFKAIGKAFKAIGKFVKKIALPVIAVAAVALTGGAALGILPSLSSMVGSLGLSSALSGVLVSAAKFATFGAVGSLLTGGNPIKGAMAGFVMGGAMGGIGALAGSAGAAGAQAGMSQVGTSAAGQAGNLASTVAKAPGLDVISNGALGSAGSASAASAASGAAGTVGGLGTVGATQAAGLAASTGAGAGVLAPVVSSAAPVTSGGGVLGGLGRFVNQNPIVAGTLIQGVGNGLMANEQAKAAERERKRIEGSYSGIGTVLPGYSGGLGGNLPNAADVFNAAIYSGKKVTYDPKTGIKVGG